MVFFLFGYIILKARGSSDCLDYRKVAVESSLKNIEIKAMTV